MTVVRVSQSSPSFSIDLDQRATRFVVVSIVRRKGSHSAAVCRLRVKRDRDRGRLADSIVEKTASNGQP